MPNSLLSDLEKKMALINRGQTKQGLDYALFLQEKNEGDFDIKAYWIRGEFAEYVGHYEAKLADDYPKEYGKFLDTKSVPDEKAVYWSYVEIDPDYQGKGFSSPLFKSLLDEFSKRKAVHAVAFSDDGNRFMRKKYLREGYSLLERKKGVAVPEEHKGFSNWMFRDYSSVNA